MVPAFKSQVACVPPGKVDLLRGDVQRDQHLGGLGVAAHPRQARGCQLATHPQQQTEPQRIWQRPGLMGIADDFADGVDVQLAFDVLDVGADGALAEVQLGDDIAKAIFLAPRIGLGESCGTVMLYLRSTGASVN